MRKQPEGAAQAARGNAGVSYTCRVAVFPLHPHAQVKLGSCTLNCTRPDLSWRLLGRVSP